MCGNFAYLRDILHGTLGVLHPKPDSGLLDNYIQNLVMLVKTFPFSEAKKINVRQPLDMSMVFTSVTHTGGYKMWWEGRSPAKKLHQTLLPLHPI